MPKQRIVVLGAGVSGLTTATLLLQQKKKFEVTVVAKHFPGDLTSEFTSPWAGAHWRSYAINDDIRQQGMALTKVACRNRLTRVGKLQPFVLKL
ncbi:nucleotide-binding domain-containing protein [Gigaspora margarita]|uniref:Nucleotide-binding domain-containing protein n=1 Tax=Gigaspora margarita TaxID=4874 RepID=A0A8H4B4D3_GIGMA|nr:nucleotide-binding domain-containing protein [Gigaspora margarita]